MKNQERTPQISVVIPFYNAYDFFSDALESVQKQTLTPLEVIVVNDGCGEKAEHFLSKFEGITVYSIAKNSGVSVARNEGVRIASGEWIAFLDADDFWLPDKLEKQVSFINQNQQYDGLHTGVETFNQTGSINLYTDKPADLTVDDLLTSSHVTPPSFIVKKSTFCALGGFDSNVPCSEDYDFTIRMISAGYKIGFLPEPLTRVRRENHGNLSSSARKIIKGHIQILTKHNQLFKTHSRSRSLFLYKTFMTAGGKIKGLEAKTYFLIGHLFHLFSSEK